MQLNKYFPIIGEFSLMVLLFLIVTASAISVISLSPVSFEQVLGEDESEGEVAGEFSGDVIVESPVSFIPSLAPEGISFGSQEIDTYSYSLDVTYPGLETGETSVDIMRVVNLKEAGQFQVDINLSKDDLENIDVDIIVGEQRVNLTDGLFEGRVFPYRFSLEHNEQTFIQLMLISGEKINYPVNVSFSLEKL